MTYETAYKIGPRILVLLVSDGNKQIKRQVHDLRKEVIMGLIKKSRMSAMRATLDLSLKAISSLEASQTELGRQMAYFELNAYLNLAQRMSWGTLARKIRKALDAAGPGGQHKGHQEESNHVAEEG